ncbi:LVIVD repeat-containing protein [Roseomonas sp. BN140053]|uniref:LVIVD repeat-containing protein n=1 Tax=Roseomonas sp. BN140053 TaxID=3391898 RepID=UPI0039EAB2E2
MQPEEARNFRLLGHDPSAAFGAGSLVEVRRGHAYVGSVGGAGAEGREGFTVHDVSDPRRPRKVWEFRAPPGVHMHKLRYVHEDLLYVNSERLAGEAGLNARAGFFIFDISRPAEPREVGFMDMPGSGPHRFGVDNERHLAFMPCDAPGWNKRVIWTLDLRDPLRPEPISIWGLPWQKTEGEGEGNDPTPAETACTLHGPPMIRGNRMYAAFWGGGVAVIDCTDLRDMKLAGHVCWSPPFVGSTHTAWPIGDRPYLVVTDEARAKQNYWDSQFMWIVDIRDEAKPTPVSTWFPEREKYFHRGGRFGAHNILENIPGEGPWANTVFITYFNAGLRAVDVSDVLRPKEVGCFVPAVADGARMIQSNDIGADEHGRLYLIDRWGQGMHIVEYTG